MVRLRRHEPHATFEAEPGDERVQPLDLALPVGTARATDHEQPRASVAERGQGANRHVDPLERLDAPDEQQHGAAVVELERGACATPRPGREERVLHAGGHDLDAIGLGAVVTDELACFLGAGREDGVGAADHRGLGADAMVVVFVVGLDARERVERRDERKLEIVLQPESQ